MAVLFVVTLGWLTLEEFAVRKMTKIVMMYGVNMTFASIHRKIMSKIDRTWAFLPALTNKTHVEMVLGFFYKKKLKKSAFN